MDELTVHPLAALFPMMADDELAELAADIKVNGLVHPIMLDTAGTALIDGRNRLKACSIAEVEPRFERLNGQDPAAYIVSVNLARRNLSKGQQAMVLAMIYPEPEKGGRGKVSVAKTSAKRGGFSMDRIDLARAVLREAPDLVPQVLNGSLTLDPAYKEVMLRLGRLKTQDYRMRDLERERPDLAERVQAGDLSIDEATQISKRDADERKQQRWAVTVNLVDAVAALDREPDNAADIASLFDPVVEEQKGSPKITSAGLRRVAAYVTALADFWEVDQ